MVDQEMKDKKKIKKALRLVNQIIPHNKIADA
jgi:hypothetical protein